MGRDPPTQVYELGSYNTEAPILCLQYPVATQSIPDLVSLLQVSWDSLEFSGTSYWDQLRPMRFSAPLISQETQPGLRAWEGAWRQDKDSSRTSPSSPGFQKLPKGVLWVSEQNISKIRLCHNATITVAVN